MRSTIGTAENLSELCTDMHNTIIKIYGLLRRNNNARSPEEKTENDAEILKYGELLGAEIVKFDNIFSQKVFRDANNIALLAQKNPAAAEHIENMLEKLEDILVEMKKTHHEDKRKNHFLFSFAHKMARRVGKLTSGVKKVEKKHAALMKEYSAHATKRQKAKVSQFPRKKMKAKIIPFPKKEKAVFRKAANY